MVGFEVGNESRFGATEDGADRKAELCLIHEVGDTASRLGVASELSRYDVVKIELDHGPASENEDKVEAALDDCPSCDGPLMRLENPASDREDV